MAICERASAYGLPAERIEHNDVLHLFERSQDVIRRLRRGEGPAFFEVMTYRWQEHVGPNQDYHLGYRTKEEAKPWQDDDQVRRIARFIDAAERGRIEADVEEEIAAAFAFAESSPFPEPAELHAHVFKEKVG
jgi:TPP-dependent pyruvate/acetoin dehydrogenase alpha subunit